MKYESHTGVIGIANLMRTIAKSLQTVGFKLKAVNGQTGSVISESTTRVMLEPSTDIDSQAEAQPWSIILDVVERERKMDVYVLPRAQVTPIFEAPNSDEDHKIGKMSLNGEIKHNFINMNVDWGLDPSAEFSALPFSFTLHVTDHGVALHVWSEGQDRKGTAFSWFCVQRSVPNPVDVPAGANSPLFAVYCIAGGQAGSADVLNVNAVQRYTVIESGVSSATKPISAVIPTPDGMPIINPLQQVALMSGTKAVVFFPQAINSQRTVYFQKLDMLGYTSADVISMGSEVTLTPNGEKVVYKACSANAADNRGMRVLFPVRNEIK